MPVLRVDLAHRPRLVELIQNLVARIDEARACGWHGEIQALNASVKEARSKLRTWITALEVPARRTEPNG